MVSGYKIIVIDEIQKIPILLDEVHNLIEEGDYRFLLTGSSARKLKREHANILGGRAGQLHFYPLCSKEIPKFPDFGHYDSKKVKYPYTLSFLTAPIAKR